MLLYRVISMTFEVVHLYGSSGLGFWTNSFSQGLQNSDFIPYLIIVRSKFLLE